MLRVVVDPGWVATVREVLLALPTLRVAAQAGLLDDAAHLDRREGGYLDVVTDLPVRSR